MEGSLPSPSTTSMMMKSITKLLIRTLSLGVCAWMACSSAGAQNIQIHYDLGRYLYPDKQKDRPRMTMTVEQQSIDRFGDTFYFVDMNFLGQGAVSANWKFLRNLRFWQGPWAWHIRYDGGLRFINANAPEPAGSRAISINDAFMTGVTYQYLSPSRRTMLSLTPLYKYIKGIEHPHNYELCGVWKLASPTGLFTATGFFSWWHQEDKRPGWNKEFKFMSQPQLWCNLNRIKGITPDFNLSIGTEVRISKNIDAPQWIVAPTLALKWSFGKN